MSFKPLTVDTYIFLLIFMKLGTNGFLFKLMDTLFGLKIKNWKWRSKIRKAHQRGRFSWSSMFLELCTRWLLKEFKERNKDTHKFSEVDKFVWNWFQLNKKFLLDINKCFQKFEDALIIVAIQIENISKIFLIDDQPLAKFNFWIKAGKKIRTTHKFIKSAKHLKLVSVE